MVDIIKLFETPTMANLFSLTGWGFFLLVYTAYRFVKSFNNLRDEKARELRIRNNKAEREFVKREDKIEEVVNKTDILKETVKERLGIK